MSIDLKNPNTPEKNHKGLTYLSYFEVMHTSYLCMNLFETEIHDHKAVKNDQALRDAAKRVSEEIGKFYQVAAEAANNFPNN